MMDDGLGGLGMSLGNVVMGSRVIHCDLDSWLKWRMRNGRCRRGVGRTWSVQGHKHQTIWSGGNGCGTCIARILLDIRRERGYGLGVQQLRLLLRLALLLWYHLAKLLLVGQLGSRFHKMAGVVSFLRRPWIRALWRILHLVVETALREGSVATAGDNGIEALEELP